MKDPLQTSQTPYEVLDVEPGIDDAALRLAFMKALKKGAQAPIAKAALDNLRRPVERAKIDLTQYNPTALSKLTPDPVSDVLTLKPSNRMSTASAWESRLKETFPEVGTIHSLAVLWYWWTEYEEQRFSKIFEEASRSKVVNRGKTNKQLLLREICKAKGFKCDPENWSTCTHGDCPWLDDCSSPAPLLAQMWQKVIAYWNTLAIMPEFWTSFSDLSKSQTEQLKRGFLDSLHNKLLDLSQRYSNKFAMDANQSSENELANIPWGWGKMTPSLQQALRDAGIKSIGDILRAGVQKLSGIKGIDQARAEQVLEYTRKIRQDNAELPEQYRMLAQLSSTEQRTAQAVIEVGVKRKNDKEVRCGVIMLRDLGFLEAVKKQLDLKLQQMHSNLRLESLKEHLSPYISIILMLNDKKAESALEAIECLPDSDRNSEEVSVLKARAFHIIATQKVSVKKYNEALANWKVALKHAGSDPLSKGIRKEIVASCQSRAASLQKKQPEQAIAILEEALTLVPDDNKLKRTLGDTLAIRGIDAVNKTQKQIEQKKGLTSEVLNDLENALADLEKAAKMGSGIATKNLEQVRRLVESAKSGMMSLPPEALECVQKANQAAERQRWDESAKWLREAVKKAGSSTPQELKKNLATCLNNAAMKKVNDAIQMLNEDKGAYEREIESFVNKCKSSLSSGEGCAYCSKSRYHSLNEPWGTVNLPGHGTILLCSECTVEFKLLLDNRPKPGHLTFDLFQSAECELREAVGLDPLSEHAAKNLKEVRELMSKLGIPMSQVSSNKKPMPATKAPNTPRSTIGPTRRTTTIRKTTKSAKSIDGKDYSWLKAIIGIIVLLIILWLLGKFGSS